MKIRLIESPTSFILVNSNYICLLLLRSPQNPGLVDSAVFLLTILDIISRHLCSLFFYWLNEPFYHYTLLLSVTIYKKNFLPFITHSGGISENRSQDPVLTCFFGRDVDMYNQVQSLILCLRQIIIHSLPKTVGSSRNHSLIYVFSFVSISLSLSNKITQSLKSETNYFCMFGHFSHNPTQNYLLTFCEFQMYYWNE